MIILPGGSGAAKIFAADEDLKQLLIDFKKNGKYIAAICVSPALVLEPFGILEGEEATAYPNMLDKIHKDARNSDILVVSNNIITS